MMTEQKLKLAERARDEYQKMTEELKKVLEDKENDLRHAKEAAVLEYRDSDALLSELGVSYNDGFDDALRQAKALYPKLDFSSVNITVSEATSVHPEPSDDTNELLVRKCPSPSPLRSRWLKEKKPVKPKTPLLLMFNKFLFVLFKYFENNLVLPVVYRVKLYICFVDNLSCLFNPFINAS